MTPSYREKDGEPVRALVLLLIALPAAACASYATVGQDERMSLARELTGRRSDKFLRLSFYVCPFFGDASKKLITSLPPDEVRVSQRPGGDALELGPAERILPAGARVRIMKVEFPTAEAMPQRPLYTPRTLPWIYLRALSEPEGVPLVLLLRPQIQSSDEFLAELDRYLSDTEVGPTYARWSEVVQQAVRSKTAVIDMPAEALEMAWGYPERKRISFVNSAKHEEWVYAGERRKAYLADGRVVRVEPGKAAR